MEKPISDKIYKRIEDYKEEMCQLHPEFEWVMIKKILNKFFQRLWFILLVEKLNFRYFDKKIKFGFLIVRKQFNLIEAQENIIKYRGTKKRIKKESSFYNHANNNKLRLFNKFYKANKHLPENEILDKLHKEYGYSNDLINDLLKTWNKKTRLQD